MNLLSDFIEQLKTNSRLRWGVWLIVWMFWLYGVLELRDYQAAEREQYRSTLASVSRLHAQNSRTEWLSRVEPARTMAVQLESRLWQASSSGLAQAAFQDWLRTALAESGVAQPQIRVSGIDEDAGAAEGGKRGPADLWKIRANLSFGLNPEGLTDLLSRIEFGERLVGIESLVIRNETAPRVEMQLIAFVQKQADAPVADAPVVPAQKPVDMPRPAAAAPAGMGSMVAPPMAGEKTVVPPSLQPSVSAPPVVPVVNPFLGLSASSSVAAPPKGATLQKNPFIPQ